MENLNSRPNFLTIIGRAIAKYADRSTALIAGRLERMYQAHMERAQMRPAPSPMAMCTERPHVSADSRVGENKSQTTGSGDRLCLVVIDESGSIEATSARGGGIGIGDDILFQARPLLARNCHSPGRRVRTRRSLNDGSEASPYSCERDQSRLNRYAGPEWPVGFQSGGRTASEDDLCRDARRPLRHAR